MGLISPDLSGITDGQVADATDFTSPLNTVINEVNGRLDANNLADNAVTTAKITDSSVTKAKISEFDKVRVTKSAVQSINDATATALTWDTETFDTGGLHSTSADTSRLTAVTDGKYLVYAQLRFASNATGFRQAIIRKNGTNYDFNQSNAATGDTTSVNVTTIVSLVATDYVEVFAYQNSGGALNVENNLSSFGMTLLP